MKNLNVKDDFFRDITSLGSYSFFFILIGVSLFSSMSLFWDLIFGFLFTLLVTSIIKATFYKDRPKKEKYSNLFEKISASTFPSLHAARATFLGVVFVMFFSHIVAKVVVIIAALLIIYSRIYMKKHYWSDALGGIVLGAITYWLTFFF